jgi:uncharacterized membrane protein YfcA
MAIPLVGGAIPAARWGSVVGKKTNTRFLKWLLAAIIAATAIKVWSGIL